MEQARSPFLGVCLKQSHLVPLLSCLEVSSVMSDKKAQLEASVRRNAISYTS